MKKLSIGLMLAVMLALSVISVAAAQGPPPPPAVPGQTLWFPYAAPAVGYAPDYGNRYECAYDPCCDECNPCCEANCCQNPCWDNCGWYQGSCCLSGVYVYPMAPVTVYQRFGGGWGWPYERFGGGYIIY